MFPQSADYPPSPPALRESCSPPQPGCGRNPRTCHSIICGTPLPASPPRRHVQAASPAIRTAAPASECDARSCAVRPNEGPLQNDQRLFVAVAVRGMERPCDWWWAWHGSKVGGGGMLAFKDHAVNVAPL